MMWRPGQVYVAALVTFLIGVGFGVFGGIVSANMKHDSQVVRLQNQNDALYGRIAELEGELAEARR